MNQYEAMFLFDPTFGSAFENCEREIQRLLDRAEAEIVFCRTWDERRLAYKIKGRKRGIYVLVYFKANADRITPLERDIQIAENVLRVLILRADHVTPEMMEQSVASHGAEASGSDGDYNRAKPTPPAAKPTKPVAPEASSTAVAVEAPATEEVKAASPDTGSSD